MIDLLWVKGKRVRSAFEVESTTTMTSALVRGSNLPQDVPKYLVIPEERVEQFQRKMKSPMFSERFEVDQWRMLYFDMLRVNERELLAGKVSLDEITNKRAAPGVVREPDVNYNLFEGQRAGV